MNLAFDLGLVAYLVATVTAVIALLSSAGTLRRISLGAMAAGLAAQTVYIGLRWHAAGRAPFSNMFESLVLFVWTLAAVYLVLRTKISLRGLDAAAAFLAALTLVYATTDKFDPSIKPLVPALQSNWLAFHVFTCFMGYGGFAVSFLAAIGYLFMTGRTDGGGGEEKSQVIETVIGKTIAFGFLFLTVGIITGSIWANSAWGSYWSWDPKETWSLITWLLYAVFLHCRFVRGWRGRRAAWMSIIGFASVLFTYFGVNYLLSGLHSYAS